MRLLYYKNTAKENASRYLGYGVWKLAGELGFGASTQKGPTAEGYPITAKKLSNVHSFEVDILDKGLHDIDHGT